MWTLLLVVFAAGSPALLQAAPIQDGKPHEDILTDFKTEGFIVDLEEILGRVKRDSSPPSDTEVPKTDIKPSTVPTLEKLSTTTNYKDTKDPTSKPSVLFSDTEGSGSGMETEPTQFTTRQITTKEAESNSIQNIEETIVQPVTVPKVKQGRRINVSLPEETTTTTTASSLPSKESEGPSTWLIIFGFCVVVGAVVCLLVAVATRDKWYGPRKSRDITTEDNNKNYSKTETLPLSVKEQEIVALMSATSIKNGKPADITASQEQREKEYLM